MSATRMRLSTPQNCSPRAETRVVLLKDEVASLDFLGFTFAKAVKRESGKEGAREAPHPAPERDGPTIS